MASWLPESGMSFDFAARARSIAIDSRAVRAAIDIVAEIDFEPPLGRPGAPVPFDRLVHLLQQVGASVDVSDGVDHGFRVDGRIGLGAALPFGSAARDA